MRRKLRTISLMTNRWLLLLLAATTTFVWSQEGQPRAGGPGPRGHPGMQQPMSPGGGMSREERQRLRDDLKAGRRDGWRQGWRGPQPDPRRARQAPMPPEEREQLRRDIRDANRDLKERR